MKRFDGRSLIGAALLASIAIGTSLQSSAWAASSRGGSTAQSKVSDKDLQAFVKAYVEYQKIKRDYELRLRTVKDGSAKKNIESEGNEKIRRALEKQGLTAQEYNLLFAAVNGNPQLRHRALELIQAERQNS